MFDLFGKKMKEEEFNKLLMKALDMPEIIEKIKKLFWGSTASSIPQSDDEQYTQLLSAKNGEMSKLKEQLDSLKMQLSAKDDEISNLKLQNKNLQKENGNLQKENDKLSVQLAEAIEWPQKMKNEIDGLSVRLKPFERISKVLDVYARIPSKTKDSLKNLLGKGSPEELISCSLRQSNLENLWELGRVLVSRQDYESAKAIGKMIEFMIEIYEKFNSSAEMLSVKIGESFDDRKHIHCENKNRVKVTEVLLPGLIINGSICLKAVVR